MSSRRGPWPLALAAAAALGWLALYTQPASIETERRSVSAVYDFVHFYRPNAELMGERWRAGDLPLWNDRQALGGPFLASLQPGALYPPNAIHRFLDPHRAFVFLAAFHLALAAVLTALFARRLGASPEAAAAGGLLFALSARMVGNVWIPPELYAGALLPGVLFCVHGIAVQPSARWAVGLGLALGLQLLAGWPYTVAMTVLASALLAFGLLAEQAIRTRAVPWRPVLYALAGGAGALALAAPQLLPTLELIGESCRAIGSVVKAQATDIWMPHDPAVFWRRLIERGGNDGVPGAPALLFAALALAPAVRRPQPAVLAIAAAGAIGLVLSFPHHLPVYDWLREVPVFGEFRFPFRYRLLTLFALAVLAALGIAHLQRGAERFGRSAALAAGALLVLVALVPALGIAGRSAPMFPRSAAEPVSALRSGPDAVADAIGSEGRPPRIYWTGRVSKIGGADRSRVVYDLEPFFLASTARLLTYFGGGRPLTVHDTPKRRTPKAPHRGARGRDPDMRPPFAGELPMDPTGDRTAVLDAISAEVVVVREPARWFAAHLEERPGALPGWRMYVNDDALPRAYRVAAAEPEPARLDAALDRLASRSFDVHRRVLLDAPPAFATEAARGDTAALPVARPVRITRDEPEAITLVTSGDTPGIVVVTDALYPGWEAAIDGEKVPLLRANTALRAVAVPAGEHTIEIRFRPWRVRAGLWLAGGAVVTGLVTLSRRRADAGDSRHAAGSANATR